jgi:hypothetical protein
VHVAGHKGGKKTKELGSEELGCRQELGVESVEKSSLWKGTFWPLEINRGNGRRRS